MKKNFIDFDQAISANRIKQTLKNMIKTDFLNLHHIHPSDHKKASAAAQKKLTAYCDRYLRNPAIKKILADRITLYTYDVNPELQYSYSKELFKDKLAAKIEMVWPHLRDLSLEDWSELSQQASSQTDKNFFERLKFWS